MYAHTLVFAPKRIPFLNSVLPKLSILEVKDEDLKDMQNGQIESEEKKNAKNLFRTSKCESCFFFLEIYTHSLLY